MIKYHTVGNICNRSCQYLVFGDDVVIMPKTSQALVAVYQELEREGQKAGLKINEEKTKYILMTRNESCLLYTSRCV